MGIDLEFQRKTSSAYTYRGESPLAQMWHDVRGSIKNRASEESFHSEGMAKSLFSAIASFLTIPEDVEIAYNDDMQAFAERFELELGWHAEPGQENDPEIRMRAMQGVMKFQDHSAEDLKAFMESDAYKGYQRHGEKPRHLRDDPTLQPDALS